MDDRISLIEETGVARFLRCNIWHVRGRDFDLVIDTGFGLNSLKDWVLSESDRPIRAICTHSHFDHVAGLHEFDCRLGHRAEADVYAEGGHEPTLYSGGWKEIEIVDPHRHPDFGPETHLIKAAPLTGFLDEGDVLDLGNAAYQVLHLPGHSPGSIGLLDRKAKTLFTGDAIYDGALYDNLPHSDPQVYLHTLARIRALDCDTFHGGHYPSFGRARMQQIVDSYRPGSPMEDICDWHRDFLAGGGNLFDPPSG